MFFYTSNFKCSLVIYRKIIEFYISTLYSTVLLYLLISYKRFFVWFFGIFYMNDYVIYKDNFFLLICSFYFLSCLITLPRTSNTMLNRNFEMGNLYLVSDIGGENPVSYIKYDVGTGCYMRQFPNILSLLLLLVINDVWFCYMLFLYYFIWLYDFLSFL